MKLFATLFFWMFLYMQSFAISESLKILIERMNGMEDGEMGYDQRLIAAWPGLESEASLNEILDELLKPGRNEFYAEESDILDSMKFSREKIVEMILEKVRERNDYESGLNRAFGLLQDYTDDPRVFPYLLGYINDKRPMGRRERMVSADYDTVAARICDCAASVIRHGLQKRGLLKPGDPAWGEPGGATSHDNADSALLLLKEFLLENQLMTQAQDVARPKKDTTLMNLVGHHCAESKTQTRRPKRPGNKDETPEPLSLWLWILGCTVAVTGSFIWAYFRRR